MTPFVAKSESLIRSACADQATPYLIGGLLFRLVENQEQIATRDLVAGDLDKQAVLETLLEPSKPPRVPGTERFDYLLATPWRYPPLRYGSRFGRRFEPSLFYGGCSATTALAESAYYRWVFLFDMETHPDSLHSQHTLYQARYRSERGLRLQQPPFADYEAILTHKSDYQETQVLGSALRAVGVEAFEYKSARDPAGGTNVARAKAHYDGLPSCRAATLVGGGPKACAWGCLGLGDCEDSCDFDAIHMDGHGLPVVDVVACTACGDCVDACPKDLFSLHPVSHRLWVACRNLEHGDAVLDDCEVACTACARCAMDAPNGLVSMVDNLPVVDYARSGASQEAIERCPTGAIVWFAADDTAVKGRAAHKIVRQGERREATS